MRSRRSTWREWRLPDRQSFIGVDCDSVRGVGHGRGQQDRVDDVDDAIAHRHVRPGTLVSFTVIASASDTANLTVGVQRRGRAPPTARPRTS